MKLNFLTPEGLTAEFTVGKQGELIYLEVGPIGQQDLDPGWARHLRRSEALTLATALEETAKERVG